MAKTTKPKTIQLEETSTGLIVPEIPKTAVFIIADQEVNKEVLLARKKEIESLQIDGIKDTAGYEAVRKANAEFRSTRTTIEKVRKEISAPHNEFVKKLKANADELGAICQEAESSLSDKMKVIDDEKEQIRLEKEREKQRIIQARVAELMALGATFNVENGTYSFEYDLGLMTNDLQLKEFDEAEFTEFLDEVKESFAFEQDRLEKERLAEQKRKQDEEAEAERVRQEGIKQTEQAKALTAKRTSLRGKELALMGFILSEAGVPCHEAIDTYVTASDMECLSDEAWEALIAKLEQRIQEAAQPKPEPEAVVQEAEEVQSEETQMYVTTHELVGAEAKVEHVEQDDVFAFPVTDEQGSQMFCLSYSKEEPFEDLPIAANFFLRVYPQKFFYESNDGINLNRIISSGKFKNENLNWMLLKKE